MLLKSQGEVGGRDVGICWPVYPPKLASQIHLIPLPIILN